MIRGLVIAVHLGWRNLWRNPRRTVITSLAIAAALLVLMTLSGLLAGVRDQLLRNGTELLMGHMQAHHADYLPDRHVADTLATRDINGVMAEVTAMPRVVAAAPRVRAHGLISSGDASAGTLLLGVEPALEGRLTTLLSLAEGPGLDAAPGGFGILLGITLAREVDARPGDELAVVTQAADGSLGNELFTVTGLLRTGTRGLDRSLAVAHLADLQALLALGPDEVHELAIGIDDPLAAEEVAALLRAEGVLPEDSRLRSWRELAPQLRDYLAMNEGASTFLILVVGLFAAFGVMNSMLMAVYERMREFGTLNALGASPRLILAALLAEAMLIAALGLLAGFAGGALVLWDLMRSGWDLTRWTGELSMMDTRLDPVLYGVWIWRDIAQAAIGLALASLIAVLLAAGRLLSIDPLEAMAAPTES